MGYNLNPRWLDVKTIIVTNTRGGVLRLALVKPTDRECIMLDGQLLLPDETGWLAPHMEPSFYSFVQFGMLVPHETTSGRVDIEAERYRPLPDYNLSRNKERMELYHLMVRSARWTLEMLENGHRFPEGYKVDLVHRPIDELKRAWEPFTISKGDGTEWGQGW